MEEGCTAFRGSSACSSHAACCMHAKVAARITFSVEQYLGRAVQKVPLVFWASCNPIFCTLQLRLLVVVPDGSAEKHYYQ